MHSRSRQPKQALENLRTQQEANFAAQIDKLTKALNADTLRETERTRDANAKYSQGVGMMETFERTQALEWPTLPLHLLRLADHARVALPNIPRDLSTASWPDVPMNTRRRCSA